MERKVRQKVDLNKIVFDEELYPRALYNWQTAYDYSMSMKTGVKFPPITLAILNGKMVLVDGKHRLEALKLLKEKKVEAEVFTGWDRKKIFEEAVRRNIAHGRILSPYEKRRIALKLRGMKYKDSAICDIIQVPEDKIENFVAQRLTNSLTGETIVKSEIKHLAGQNYDQEIELTQKAMYSRSQVSILNEVVRLLEKNLFDLENKQVQKLLNKLKNLII